MKIPKSPARKSLRSNRLIQAIVPLALAVSMTPFQGHAASSDDVALKEVLKRLDAQAEEIKALKANIGSGSSSSVPTSVNATPEEKTQWQQTLQKQEAEIKNLKEQMSDMSAVNTKPKYPSISFHGFGDVNYSADGRRGTQLPYGQTFYGSKNGAYLGELDLFLNAQLAENTSFISENVISIGSDNHSGWDIERLILEFRANDYFNIDIGRLHTALGYYNTTYHHGSWLQNAVGRPSFLQFEDSGGILPVHLVGASVHGKVPSGNLNLNYYVEGGNGANFTDDGSNPVQMLVSHSDSKAVNVALAAKPEWLPGLQFGGGLYYDVITPTITLAANPSVPRNTQYIYNGHIVYHTAQWELIAEGYLINDHAAGSSSSHNSTAWFAQASRKFNDFTPFARFTHYNVSRNDSLYTVAWNGGLNAGVHYGPSLGLRYDLSSFVALKAQYDYLLDSGLNDASRITVQAAFTF